MVDTRRFTGTGRLKTILDAMACWRMKLLHARIHREMFISEFSSQFIEKENGYDRPENACIRRESCDRDANVVIDAKHLLLV